jgi:hypothetical protein
MHGFAEDYSAVLGRRISYVPQDADAWIETYVNSVYASRNPHVASHIRSLVHLVAGGRYDVIDDQLERLLGRTPKDMRWALQQSPRIREAMQNA